MTDKNTPYYGDTQDLDDRLDYLPRPMPKVDCLALDLNGLDYTPRNGCRRARGRP